MKLLVQSFGLTKKREPTDYIWYGQVQNGTYQQGHSFVLQTLVSSGTTWDSTGAPILFLE
jgi:hypothetical protein